MGSKLLLLNTEVYLNKVPNSLNIEMECLRNIENSDIITTNNDWVTFCYDQVLQEVCSFNLLLISHFKVKQVKTYPQEHLSKF